MPSSAHALHPLSFLLPRSPALGPHDNKCRRTRHPTYFRTNMYVVTKRNVADAGKAPVGRSFCRRCVSCSTLGRSAIVSLLVATTRWRPDGSYLVVPQDHCCSQGWKGYYIILYPVALGRLPAPERVRQGKPSTWPGLVWSGLLPGLGNTYMCVMSVPRLYNPASQLVDQSAAHAVFHAFHAVCTLRSSRLRLCSGCRH